MRHQSSVSGDWPNSVLVLGGGRWGRILTRVLVDIAPEGVRIDVCSNHGAAALRRWAVEQKISDRVGVLAQRPDTLPDGSNAVIVANAARDHLASGLWALQRGAAVLIEKPLALTEEDARRLADAASDRGALLLPAMVLRFARYLDRFAAVVAGAGEARSITIDWADQTDDARYGEPTLYDAGVPVFADCMPHVVSLLLTVFGELPTFNNSVGVMRGGARVEVNLAIKGVPCIVTFERRAPQRRRLIRVATDGDSVELDFALEPGTIKHGGVWYLSVDDWTEAPRPLATLLNAFIGAVGGGAIDKRLDFAVAMNACGLTDSIGPAYLSKQAHWLMQQPEPNRESDIDETYALAELLQAQGPLSSSRLDLAMRGMRARITAAARSTSTLSPDWLATIAEQERQAAMMTEMPS